MTQHMYAFATLNPIGGVNDVDWNMTAVLELSEPEYDECVKACALLGEYRKDAELFQIVIWNYDDYVDLFNRSLKSYANKQVDSLFERRPDLDLNRCLMNLLSSIRSYLDYTELKLKRRHGKNSAIVVNFKQLCSTAYDNTFSYRFLYRYRNFAQHCGLPLTRVIFHVSEHDEYSLEVSIKKLELLSGFDWGPLQSEMAEQPELININDHVYQMMKSLDGIHLTYLRDEVARLQPSAILLKSLLDKTPKFDDELYLAKFPELSKDEIGDPFNITFQMVPVDVIGHLLENSS